MKLETMKKLFPPVLLSLAICLCAPAAHAANTRYAQANGTALGNGVVIIETFSKPILPRGSSLLSPAACTPCMAQATIPAGFTCDQTAAMLADSLTAQLPVDYTVSVHGSYPAVVVINYTGVGTFTMNISDTIPGQSVQEVPAGAIPTLSEWGVILLGLILVGLALVMIRRRSRAAPAAV